MQRIQQCALALIAVLSFALAHAASGELRTVDLKHRTATEVLPIVRPLLAPGGAISGEGFRLFVRTSKSNFRQIERAVALIDTPLRNFKITVRQSSGADDSSRVQRFAGQATIGDHTRIIISRPSAIARSGLEVRHRRETRSLQYQTERRTSSREQGATHFLRVREGERAFIRIGQSISRIEPFLILSNTHARVITDVTYQDVTTGFEVVARARGDRVLLEITPKLSFHSGHTFQPVTFHELSTTVTVAIGEWIDLGSAFGMGNQVTRAILDSSATQTSQRYRVMLKVE